MVFKKCLILGAGGLASEVYELLTELNIEFGGFVVSKEYLNEYRHALCIDSLDTSRCYLIRGVGDMEFARCALEKYDDNPKIASATAHIGKYAKIGNGSVVFPLAYVSGSAAIGMHCIIYPNSTITHDVLVGDGTIVAANASLLGRSKIGKFTWIGAGSVIMPGLRIGNNCKIGAGAVVCKDVPDESTAFGVPAVIQ